jgi:hypothetical protein
MLFCVWLTTLVMSVVVLMSTAWQPPENQQVAIALERCALGLVPAGLVSVHWAFLLGSGLAVVPLMGSFLDAPSRDLPPKWRVARWCFVLAWGSGTCVAVTSVIE